MTPFPDATRHALLPGPLGEMLLGFDDEALHGLWFVGQKDQRAIEACGARDDAHPIASRVARAVARYFDGEAVELDVPLRLHGTAFQRSVWQALLAIPYGRTTSYAAVAASVGVPSAVRAVGAAVGRNPVSIFVPCHRVVGSDGSLTGYAGGLPRKIRLLEIERVLDERGRVRTGPPMGQGTLDLGTPSVPIVGGAFAAAAARDAGATAASPGTAPGAVG